MTLVEMIVRWFSQDADRPARFSGAWWVDALVGAPLRIAVVVVLALVLRWLVHRGVDRLTARVVSGERALRGRAPAVLARATDPGYSERRALRATTMGSLFKSIASATMFAVTLVIVLAEIGIDVAPIVASAGIAGIALGFGAQNLVKDFLSGIFMLLEDQYGVGDVVDMGDASGVVEQVGLRVTQLRDVSGTVWYLRNGEVVRVGNKSQGWARAVVDVAVGYREDLDHVRAVLLETAATLRQDPDLASAVLEDPEVWGVEQLSLDAVVIRVVVKTAPGEQFAVARVLRQRLSHALRHAGVEVPPPFRAGAPVPPPT